MWRYIGGMAPLHDDFSQMASPPTTYYTSPIAGDPDCFINNAVIISGGQPQFDSNSAIMAKSATIPSGPNNKPFVTEDPGDAATPTEPGNIEPPKYIHDYYVSALAPSSMPASFPNGTTPDRNGGVALFVHNTDAWHSATDCQEGSDWTINGYPYGYPASCGSDGVDTTGTNVIDAIHTVAMGSWTLGPLYATNGSGFLDNALLKQAAIDGGGNFYGLTPGTPDNSATFSDLTDLFNALGEGTPADVVAGMPHFTSAFIQPFIDGGKTFGPESYLPVTLPIDNSISRFWFGNLKKYSFNTPNTDCFFTNDNGTGWAQFSDGHLEGDCFTPSTSAGAIDTLFTKTLNSGAYLSLLDQLDSCSGSGTEANPCFATNTSRHIYYEKSDALIEIGLTAKDTVLTDLSAAISSTLSTADTSKIIDYMYGYDVYNDDSDKLFTDKRDAIISVTDPNDIDFTSTATVDVKMSILGAIVHSIPIAVHYGGVDSTRIYFGAADGMMHSFKEDGTEAWAYIPSPILSKLTFIADNTGGLKYESTVDGPIALMHFDDSPNGIVNTGEKAYLIFGYRRGAHAYTVIDVSDPDEPSFVQHIATVGESWGKPLLFTRGGEQYMAITSGYDNCADATIPSCSAAINHSINIYKWDASTTKFALHKTYNKASDASDNAYNAKWLVLPFAADGVAINITQENSTDADFLYFIDILGSVFRIELRESPWKFHLAFKNRSTQSVTTAKWGTGFRSYHSFATFPPRKQYLTATNTDSESVIPIPVVTGNAVNTSIVQEPNKVFVFYDPVVPADIETPILFTGLKSLNSLETHLGDSLIADASYPDGWIWGFNLSSSKKVITRPLVYYDAGDTEMWYFMWNTFSPAAFGECKNAGNAHAYFRMLANGTEVPKDGKWKELVGQNAFDLGEGRPTDMVTLGSSKTGSLPVAGAGDNQFSIQGFELIISAPASVLKWYELY